MAKVIINHGEASTVLTVSEPNLQFVHSAISFHDRRDRRIDDISHNFLALQQCYLDAYDYLNAAKERSVAIVELLDRVFQQVYDDDMCTSQTIEIQE